MPPLHYYFFSSLTISHFYCSVTNKGRPVCGPEWSTLDLQVIRAASVRWITVRFSNPRGSPIYGLVHAPAPGSNATLRVFVAHTTTTRKINRHRGRPRKVRQIKIINNNLQKNRTVPKTTANGDIAPQPEEEEGALALCNRVISLQFTGLKKKMARDL